MNPDTAILGPAAHKEYLLGSFLQELRPKGTKEEIQIHFSHSAIQRLSSIDRSAPLLRSAVAALCLAHFGKQSADPRVLRCSQIYYGHVLGILRKALSESTKSNKAWKPRDVLTGIMLVGLYDESTPANQRGPRPWEVHLWGALQYLQAVGPGSLNLNDTYDLTLLRNLQGASLALGFARRKTLLFSLPEWRALRRKHVTKEQTNDHFGILAVLPTLLERADTLLEVRSHAPTGTRTDILDSFAQFRTEVNTCLRTSFSSEGVDGISTAETAAFDLSVEEHIVIINSRTFDRFYRFDDRKKGIAKVRMGTLCWLALLLSDCTVLQLLSHGPRDLRSGILVNDARQRAHYAADQLCRSVYVLSQLGSIAFAEYTYVLLRVAQAFYEASGSARKMVWCQMCMSATRIRIDRLRSMCPPSLCRIGDLADPLASAVRRLPTGPHGTSLC